MKLYYFAGTLDGFSFDSEEETDKVTKNPAHQSDQTNADADHTDKTKVNYDTTEFYSLNLYSYHCIIRT